MMKLFRVHHVHANGLETLALTVSAGGLKSAVKRVREHPLIRLPNGTYYILPLHLLGFHYKFQSFFPTTCLLFRPRILNLTYD